MTRARQIALVNEIRRLQAEVETLAARRTELLTGAASASISAGAGSKSYSNWDPERLAAAIAEDQRVIARLKRALSGRAPFAISSVPVRRI